MRIHKVALVGASGFVGSAVKDALEPAEVVAIKAPRLSTASRTVAELLAEAAVSPLVADLSEAMHDVDAVINAAGDPDASSLDVDALIGANALLPALLLAAAERAGVRRFVHISSAVVQNDKPVLDSSEDMRPFSPYSLSKVLGELALREFGSSNVHVVRYRPPSVHAPDRRVTRMIAKIARSPLASVARPGDQGTPQTMLPNVASAIAFLATTDQAEVPTVVHHPSEGLSVSQLMLALGDGRAPRRIPRSLARMAVGVAKLAGRIHRPTAANARRLELLWLGQDQAPSWLTAAGWIPPAGRDAWTRLVP